jgi:hypothetical protein
MARGASSTEPGTDGTGAEQRDSLLPFAKAYNDYFRSVYGIGHALRSKVCDAYPAYAKAIRAASDKQDLQALHEANEQFRTILNDAANPSPVAEQVRAAFDHYRRDLRAAFASDDGGSLDAANLALVTWSMAQVVASWSLYRRI